MPCNGSLGDCDCTCLGAREEGEGKAKREGEEQEEEAELWIVSNILEPIQDVRPLRESKTAMTESNGDGLFEVVDNSIGWNFKGCSGAAISRSFRRKVNDLKLVKLLSKRCALCVWEVLRRTSMIARAGE
ncbi:hypothetical protein AK812_SmicGene24392 [Symbiodinium microadriaticum]|uniref:Uncharacterized protein n=1 Tax=Symbiodinium microadriaticum TaxID=2951 RepID=A0A1Q9DEU0_SYMMI|nr:hypothetical protein AK812_SmicGene24392 [Symbiodinium microadriaticum]